MKQKLTVPLWSKEETKTGQLGIIAVNFRASKTVMPICHAIPYPLISQGYPRLTIFYNPLGLITGLQHSWKWFLRTRSGCGCLYQSLANWTIPELGQLDLQ